MTFREGLEPIKYEAALRKAWDEISDRDPSEISEMADAPLLKDDIVVPFLGDDHIVNFGRKEITKGGGEVPPFIAVLILHYLKSCGPQAPSGEFVTFGQIPGGEMYYPTFKKRAIDRIAETFGSKPQKLLETGVLLDAKKLKMGDASIEVPVFPKISIAIIVWEGDEELPSSANILFGSTALDILPMEDLSVVANLVVSLLVKQMEKGDAPPDERPEVQGRG